MSSQLETSQNSTILYSQNTDDEFTEELDNVDHLYFHETSSQTDRPSNEFPFLYADDVLDDFSDEIVSDHSDSDNSDGYQFDQRDQSCMDESISPTSVDKDEHEICEKLKTESCGCTSLHKGTPCSSVVCFKALHNYRQDCLSMTTAEKDIVIKTQLNAHRVTSGQTKKKTNERRQASQQYYFKGLQICKTTFCFAHAISRGTLQSIARSLDIHGLLPRQHGNSNRLPANALKLDDRVAIKKFIEEYATENGLPLPGRLPNCPKATVLLLPSDKNIADIHTIYQNSACAANLRRVCLKTFRSCWHDMCPHINLAKPMTDLCQKCQQYGTKIHKSGLLSDAEKHDVIVCYSEHLNLAAKQREVYKSMMVESKTLFAEKSLKQGADPCSEEITYHYSWDFAQNIHYPHHVHQVGPIYFATPRKCHVFGMCAEGSGKQTFYLVDEAELPGKGADSVVSMVHHYFQHYGVGETHAEVEEDPTRTNIGIFASMGRTTDVPQIHFDNAVGQNKNHTVLWYAMWRVLTGLHESITLNMMLAGHTKFSPDWHFGVWKVKWRKSDAETMSDIAATVSASSRSGHNVPQLAADPTKPVMFYAWGQYLQKYFSRMKNITKYHHFTASLNELGSVWCRETCDSEPTKIKLLKTNPTQGELPSLIRQPQLDITRQWYLHDVISKFFRSEQAKELVCPRPVLPKPCTKGSKHSIE